MNTVNQASLSSLLFLQHKMPVKVSMDMICEWLKNHPQESLETLASLYKSEKVFVEGNKLLDVAKLSLEEALSLAEKIQQENILEIKNRRYHLKRYPQCFIGSELVDYLVKNKGKTTGEAIYIGQDLLEYGLIQHVCNEHTFKNDFLFYRFNN